MTARNEEARGQGGLQGAAKKDDIPNGTPLVAGQCAQVLNLIRERQPIISFDLTCTEIIPEAAARVHDLRCMGFNILTTIHPAVEFRGVIRRNVASYSLGSPEWPRPGFFDVGPAAVQIELDLNLDRRVE